MGDCVMAFQENVFNTYDEGVLPAILDTMKAMRVYNDENGYTSFMFGSLEKYHELDSYYQQYLDGEIGDQDVLNIYHQNKDFIRGRWDELKERLDSKWAYKVFNDEPRSEVVEWFDISNYQLPIENE
jgi:hypothetical protein